MMIWCGCAAGSASSCPGVSRSAMPSNGRRRASCSRPGSRRSCRSLMPIPSPASPRMSSSSSRRSRTRCACRAGVRVLVALVLPCAAAAQGDERVDVLTHLLAAADARSFDADLFRSALVAPDPFVRRHAPLAALTDCARDPDPAHRANAISSLARLKLARAATTLLGALVDADPYVRAVALRGISRALSDSARRDPQDVVARIRPLLGDRNGHVRVNALRALASFKDSTLAPLALPLLTDADVNVAVQAETTLGALGGPRATAALAARLTDTDFARRRQAAIALAQADSAAGVTAAATLAREGGWRWRSVAVQAVAAAPDRARLAAAPPRP